MAARGHSTNEQYTPTEFCNALWQHKTVDPITGWPLSGVWETMTNPTQVGNLDVWIVAKWSGTGKDGLVEVFFAPSQDEVVAMVRKSMH